MKAAQSSIAIVMLLIILRHILENIEAKSSSQMGAFFYPMFANCVHTQNDVGQKCSRLREIRLVDT